MSPIPAPDKPTIKQQRELRRLAQLTGTSFTPPKTRRQASAEIARLRARRPTPWMERALERLDQRQPVRRGDDARVLEGVETTGYGSTATWR